MISKLTIRFDVNDKLKYSYNLGSVLQGVMMENISHEYAGALHISQVHPYSQHSEYEGGSLLWVISALNGEAGEQLLAPFFIRFL